MTPFEFLNNHVLSYVAPSPIDGVGLFALKDIPKGVDIFKKWDGETDIYSIKFRKAKLLPQSVLELILKSFSNQVINDDSNIYYRLINGVNFLISEPTCLLNTGFENGNVDSVNGISLKSIKAGEEILGNYGKSSQVKPHIEVI